MEKRRTGIQAQDQSRWMREKKKDQSIKRSAYPLTKTNVIMMAASGVMIVLGFLLMLGGANDGAEFNSDIFSTRRTVVGPTIAFLGFLAMAFAIIYKKK